eukprot:scaffold85792_cov62-Phaeocystis_antarctica.AAC.4
MSLVRRGWAVEDIAPEGLPQFIKRQIKRLEHSEAGCLDFASASLVLSLCSSVKTKATNVFSVLAAALLTGRSVSLPALPSGEVRRGTPKGSNGTNAALVEHTQAHTKVRILTERRAERADRR